MRKRTVTVTKEEQLSREGRRELVSRNNCLYWVQTTIYTQALVSLTTNGKHLTRLL